MHTRRGKQWTGQYITDFNKLLLTQNPSEGEEDAEDEEDQETNYSFISRSMRYRHGTTISSRDYSNVDESSLQLARTASGDNQQLAVLGDQSPAMRFLNEKRTFRGLEQKLGETPIAEMVEGRSGIAKGYTHEQDMN